MAEYRKGDRVWVKSLGVWRKARVKSVDVISLTVRIDGVGKSYDAYVRKESAHVKPRGDEDVPEE
jgi:hypothetical protein